MHCTHYHGCYVAVTVLYERLWDQNGCFAHAIGCGLRVVFDGNVQIQINTTTASSANTLTINSTKGITLGSNAYFDYAEGSDQGAKKVFKPKVGAVFGTFHGTANSTAGQTVPVSYSSGTLTFDTGSETITFNSLVFNVTGLTQSSTTGENTVGELNLFMVADTSTTTLQVDSSNNNSMVFNLVFSTETDLYASSGNVSGTLNKNKSRIQILGNLAHGGTFGTVSFSFSLFHLTGAIFSAQAYSVGFGSFKCAVESGCPWPTQGIGGFRSFFWWLCCGLKNGNRRFWSLADVDIISVIS